MSEMETFELCPGCGKYHMFLWSGSGKHGVSMHSGCDFDMPEDRTADLKHVVSYNG